MSGALSDGRKIRTSRVRWISVFGALAALLVSTTSGAEPDPTARPLNLVLLIGDDVGYPDFGFMGSPHVRTPHLDRLAETGVVFRNGYSTASVCKPSLRSLLTGLHPYQWQARVAEREKKRSGKSFGIDTFGTLPRILAGKGYASFQGGKIWEASFGAAGFTHGMPVGGEVPNSSGAGVGRSTMLPVFDFIDAHRDAPFFLWFAPKLPHLPHDAPDEFVEPYLGKGFSGSAVQYYANVTRFDSVVGQLIAHLESRRLLDRTVIVYISDNGWDQTEDSPRIKRRGFSGPRGKHTMYDLGFRTPIVVSWRGGLAPRAEARDELVSAVDLFPTFLDYAGALTPARRPGSSLRPLLDGTGSWQRTRVAGTMAQLRETNRSPAKTRTTQVGYFVRSGQWHYVRRKKEMLFDVVADPREVHDLAATRPEIVERLRGELEAWRTEMREQARKLQF